MTLHQQVLDANAGHDLEGLPGPVNVPGNGPLHFHSNRDIQRIAEQYNAQHGMPTHPNTYTPVSPQQGARVAQAYDEMEHDPNDPEVKEAYDALAREVRQQYDHATKNGYNFEFYPEGQDPYPNSPREAVLDLHHNKHMYVYPTETGYGMDENPADHPLLSDSGVRWGGKPVTHNDLFRAIHDFYGHAKEGVGFRAAGEDNAYRQHAAMFTPPAQRALASETRGQNSWVNYGWAGAHNQTAKQGETIFAPQKAGLLPSWASDPNLHVNAPNDLSRQGPAGVPQNRSQPSVQPTAPSNGNPDWQSAPVGVPDSQPGGYDQTGTTASSALQDSTGGRRVVRDRREASDALGSSRSGRGKETYGQTSERASAGRTVAQGGTGGWTASSKRGSEARNGSQSSRKDSDASGRRDRRAQADDLHSSNHMVPTGIDDDTFYSDWSDTHDYDPRWDYESDLRPEWHSHPLMQVANDRLHSLTGGGGRAFAMDLQPRDTVGMYAYGTGQDQPGIFVDPYQHERHTDSPEEARDQMIRTVDHEYRHAQQEAMADGNPDWDEGDAEDWRTSAYDWSQQPAHLRPAQHRLEWKPGTPGKGFILTNGSVWTWPTENMRPQHMEYSQRVKRQGLQVKPQSAFHIEPEGRLWNYNAPGTLPSMARQFFPEDKYLINNVLPKGHGMWFGEPGDAPPAPVQADEYGHATGLLDRLQSPQPEPQQPDPTVTSRRVCGVCNGRPYTACPGCVK